MGGQKVVATILNHEVNFGVVQHLPVFFGKYSSRVYATGRQLQTIHRLDSRVKARRPCGLSGAEADDQHVCGLIHQQEGNVGEQFLSLIHI